MKVLYYDCFSGISGDMNIGAMIDLGLDRDILLANLSRLEIEEEYEIEVRKEGRNGITGTRFDVRLSDNPDHHRCLGDVEDLIRSAKYSDYVEATSLNIFRRIADAESKVHGVPLEEVHFHEVGATDSIIDIVGSAICLEMLDVHKIVSSPVELGGGFVDCQHGRLPVPAPATCEILRGLPVTRGAVEHEATTPTGAAILAETADEFTSSAGFTMDAVGYGVGRRDGRIPNLLRLVLGDVEPGEMDSALLLECNIDDMNPELYGNLMEELFEAGASDVFY
nr:nickel pincer cofactor biosynthesis protein LarC [Candidatus Methanofastidiosa archaeon]